MGGCIEANQRSPAVADGQEKAGVLVLLDTGRHRRDRGLLYRDLYLTSGSYFVFLIMAFTGYLAWRKGMRIRTQTAEEMLIT